MWSRGKLEVDLTLHIDVDRGIISRALGVLKWRNIDPHRGRSVVAVACDAQHCELNRSMGRRANLLTTLPLESPSLN